MTKQPYSGILHFDIIRSWHLFLRASPHSKCLFVSKVWFQFSALFLLMIYGIKMIYFGDLLQRWQVKQHISLYTVEALYRQRAVNKYMVHMLGYQVQILGELLHLSEFLGRGNSIVQLLPSLQIAAGKPTPGKKYA